MSADEHRLLELFLGGVVGIPAGRLRAGWTGVDDVVDRLGGGCHGERPGATTLAALLRRYNAGDA